MARWQAQVPDLPGCWAYREADFDPGIARVEEDDDGVLTIWLEQPVRIAHPEELEGLRWLDLEER